MDGKQCEICITNIGIKTDAVDSKVRHQLDAGVWRYAAVDFIGATFSGPRVYYCHAVDGLRWHCQTTLIIERPRGEPTSKHDKNQNTDST